MLKLNNLKNNSKQNFRPLSGINLNKNQSLITLNQSPKIYSSKFRQFINENNNNKKKNFNKNINNKQLFSLNDINDKITNSRGINFSSSFKRYSIEELKNIIKGKEKEKTQTTNNNNNNNEKNENKKNNKKEFIPKSYRITNKFKSSKDLIQRCYSATQRENNIKFKNKSKSNSLIPTVKNKINNNNNVIKEIKEIRKDCYMPSNYLQYSKLVNNPKMFLENVQKNIKKNAPNYSLYTAKVMIDRIHNTDVFFIKNQSENEKKQINKYNLFRENYKKNTEKFYNSDIFNIKPIKENDILKSSEKYLYNKRTRNKFSNIESSESEWEPNKNLIFPSSNLPSKPFDILSPNRKGFVDNKKNFQTFHLQKGIMEYYDLTQVNSANVNKKYQSAYLNDINAFHKFHGICSDFYDSYGKNKELVNKPFVKEKNIKC